MFMEANLKRANITNSSFAKSFFGKANLKEANFTNSNLKNCVFSKSSCIATIFKHADCSYSDFSFANLTGADFTQANLFMANLYKTIEEHTIWDGTNKKNITKNRQRFRRGRKLATQYYLEENSMKNIAKKLDLDQPWLEYGNIVAFKNQQWIVKTNNGEIQTKKSISCLIKPEIGDKVLISIDSQGESFILSVLDRAKENKDINLNFQGNVNIESRSGKINLIAKNDISLASQNNLTLASNIFFISSHKGDINIQSLAFTGKKIKASLKKIKMVCISVEQVIERLTQKLINSFKFVKEHNEVQSNSSRYLVEETLIMHSKNATHMSEEIITINGEQVHLG
ncbi:MAG: Uncharacterized protein XD41_1898 [Desulfonauticus sp. 38_4375]|nr:MAG: Uncharacterized protein XD41_1898 [Desulfonauticus sp. 38_4375]